MDVGWESAFVAMTMALGDSQDEAIRALVEGAAERSDPALASPDKAQRTRALALVLGAIAKDAEATELRWPS
jgi:hypothetical protein